MLLHARTALCHILMRTPRNLLESMMNHINWVPSMLPHNLSLIFMGMKQKIENWWTQKNWVLQIHQFSIFHFGTLFLSKSWKSENTLDWATSMPFAIMFFRFACFQNGKWKIGGFERLVFFESINSQFFSIFFLLYSHW